MIPPNLDHHLFVQFANSDSGDTKRFALNLDTGVWHEQTLSDGEQPVNIYAASENEYLVRLCDIETEYQDYTPDEVPFTNTMLLPHYVLISKKDYWSNQPKYIEFQNQVYKNVNHSVS